MPGQIKIDDGAGNYTILTNAGSLGSDKTITIPNTTGTMALTSDISAGGLSVADQWILTADAAFNGDITSNLARSTEASLAPTIGSGVSESSGIFTFPETGIYKISVQAQSIVNNSYGDLTMYINTTTDNFSTTDNAARILIYENNGVAYDTSYASVLFDVTDTTTHKVKFTISGWTNAAEKFLGNTQQAYTAFQFLKIGET